MPMLMLLLLLLLCPMRKQVLPGLCRMVSHCDLLATTTCQDFLVWVYAFSLSIGSCRIVLAQRPTCHLCVLMQPVL